MSVCRSLRFDKVTCLESAFCRILQSSFPIISSHFQSFPTAKVINIFQFFCPSRRFVLPVLQQLPSFRASAVSHGFRGKGPALKRAEVPRRSPRWCIRFAFQFDRHESRSSSKYVMYNNYICIYKYIYIYVCMIMYVWMDGWMYACMHACMHVCLSVCMDGWMDVCMHACMYVCLYGWMDVWMDVCMHACMHVCMSVCMDGWMDVWMDGCMDGWMDVCMHACMYVCLYVCLAVCLSVSLSGCLSNYQVPPGIVIIRWQDLAIYLAVSFSVL